MSTPNHQNREDNQAPLLGHPNLPANYASDLLPPHDGPLDDTMIPQPGMGGNISKIPLACLLAQHFSRWAFSSTCLGHTDTPIATWVMMSMVLLSMSSVGFKLVS